MQRITRPLRNFRGAGAANMRRGHRRDARALSRRLRVLRRSVVGALVSTAGGSVCGLRTLLSSYEGKKRDGVGSLRFVPRRSVNRRQLFVGSSEADHLSFSICYRFSVGLKPYVRLPVTC